MLSLQARNTRLRADSVEKWWILFLLSTLMVGSYHCILCISALQWEMTATLDLSDGEFALYTSIVFGASALISMLVPRIVGSIGLHNTMISASCCLCIGQLVFLSAVYFFVQHWLSRTASMCLQYFGRVLIGIAYGIDNITVYSMVNVWFKDSGWLEMAVSIVACTFELGMLTSRYGLTPIYSHTGSLPAAFCFGLVLGLFRIVSCLLVKRCEKRLLHGHVQHSATLSESERDTMDATSMALDESLHSDASQLLQFDTMLWCVIGYLVIGGSITETFLTQFTFPLMYIFNVNEEYANMLMSIGAISALASGLFWGWFINKTGCLSYYLISCMVLLFLAVFAMQMYEWLQLPNDDNLNYVMAWFCIVCFVTGTQHFFCAAISSLLIVAGLRLSVVANSVSAVLFLSASMSMAYLFGVLVVDIDDGMSKNYQSSLSMMSVTLAAGLVVAVVIHVMDVRRNGPLHKSTMELQFEMRGESGETTPLLP